MKKNLIPAIALLLFASCNNDPKPEAPKTGEKETPKTETTAAVNPNVTDWMSWEGGIDVAGVTDKNYKMPNVIFHVANIVNTPVGKAPSGMILYRPDTLQPPLVMGFVSTNKTVGDYFGPKIFAGTPFEKAPTVMGTFDIKYDDKGATAKVVAGGHTFECTMSDLGKPYLINRAMGSPMPFYQQGVERTSGKSVLKVDGKEVNLTMPPVGLSGGPGAVVSVNGVYAR
ncbi:MAG: hypothetical protein KA319_03705 [Ferruginibacter sp.]|nr:hypothetical protein [Ferruginibacter sp.]